MQENKSTEWWQSKPFMLSLMAAIGLLVTLQIAQQVPQDPEPDVGADVGADVETHVEHVEDTGWEDVYAYHDDLGRANDIVIDALDDQNDAAFDVDRGRISLGEFADVAEESEREFERALRVLDGEPPSRFADAHHLWQGGVDLLREGAGEASRAARSHDVEGITRAEDLVREGGNRIAEARAALPSSLE